MIRIPRIVLTGGPCAGKTTALAHMSEWCTEHGYHPLIVPEAATALIGGGLNPRRPEFQTSVLVYVSIIEQIFDTAAQKLADEGLRPVLICDRGICDQESYMDKEAFLTLLDKHNLSHVSVRDERYDGVIFLRSAANGAEEFYGTASNGTRYESLEEARALDERTLDAWVGTPHLFIIENTKDVSFEHKIAKAVGTLARILGEPEPVEAERKFLVEDFHTNQLPAHTIPIDVVQTYLVGKTGHAERVRARGQNNQWVFTHTIKEPKGPGVSIERERMITQREYESMLIRRDTSRRPIHKTRYCFVHEGHHCELDVFSGHLSGMVMLEIETAEDARNVALPPYLNVSLEVTDDRDYSNYELAKNAA